MKGRVPFIKGRWRNQGLSACFPLLSFIMLPSHPAHPQPSAFPSVWDAQISWQEALSVRLIKRDFCAVIGPFALQGTCTRSRGLTALWPAVFMFSILELPSQAVGARQGSCQPARPSVSCLCSQAPEEWLICKARAWGGAVKGTYYPQHLSPGRASHLFKNQPFN